MPITRAATRIVTAMMVAAIALLGFTLLRPRSRPPATRPDARPVLRGADPAAVSGAPHILTKRTVGLDAGSAIEVVPLNDPAAARATTTLECERISFGGGRGICLRTHLGVVTTYEAVVFDAAFRPVAALKLDGAPTRTRVSPDGRYGAATVFVTGQEHGYNSISFSTKTVLLEMATTKVIGDLEGFTTTKNGQTFSAKDFNFWGVTFAQDSNVFYATVMTAGQTYLVKGDVAARSMTVLRESVECPALSPDGAHLAYKKRSGIGTAPWRFHVLDLATMAEHPLEAESRSIDDQIEWLDNGHVLYATTRSSQSAIADVWVAPISGRDPARPLVLEAASPIVVR